MALTERAEEYCLEMSAYPEQNLHSALSFSEPRDGVLSCCAHQHFWDDEKIAFGQTLLHHVLSTLQSASKLTQISPK